jgi:general secretion pathway protein J
MKNARGFTLLEIIVATGMVAVLAGSLYASLHIAFRAKESATRAVENVRKLNLAFSLLKQDLESAMIPNGTLATSFTGGASADAQEAMTLAFYATNGDGQPREGEGDVRLVDFYCQQADDSNQMELVRDVTIARPVEVVAEPTQEVICRGVKSFSLRFFDGTTWQESWDSTTVSNVLPTAVEITIELDTPSSSTQEETGYRMTRVIRPACGQNVTTPTEGT